MKQVFISFILLLLISLYATDRVSDLKDATDLWIGRNCASWNKEGSDISVGYGPHLFQRCFIGYGFIVGLRDKMIMELYTYDIRTKSYVKDT